LLIAAAPLAGMESKAICPNRFTVATDSRKRKIRGLCGRGEKFYLQIRLSGERSASCLASPPQALFAMTCL